MHTFLLKAKSLVKSDRGLIVGEDRQFGPEERRPFVDIFRQPRHERSSNPLTMST